MALLFEMDKVPTERTPTFQSDVILCRGQMVGTVDQGSEADNVPWILGCAIRQALGSVHISNNLVCDFLRSSIVGNTHSIVIVETF